jgi:hypothetical protein
MLIFRLNSARTSNTGGTGSGLAIAKEIMDYIKNFNFESNHLNYTDVDGEQYEIYYVMASDDISYVPIPRNCKYSISGNTDVFIATQKSK